jgi:hypothetical protein
MSSSPKVRPLRILFAATLAVFLAAGSARAEDGYGYLRTVEGPAARLAPSSGRDAGDRSDSGYGDAVAVRDADDTDASINQPILVGDHLSVPDRGLVEAVLADGNVVRLDGGSELTFTRLAASADTEDRASVLTLEVGNLQLLVGDDSRGDDFPRIETGNATLYVEAYGSYRVTTEGSWTEVVVRRGRVRLVTEGDETTVRAGEQAVIDGEDREAEVQVAEEGPVDALERWGRRLDDEARTADLGSIDPEYRYEAASLSRYGSWVTVENERYWRPRVEDEWRPYWRGQWVYTPSGLTWVSSDPWGWMPAHYGTWDYLPTYGWLWQPGYSYAPAWVYWYWGSSQVGWCPTGYYTRYYGASFGRGVGFRAGVYGWAGGNWGDYGRWNFVDYGHLGSRDQWRHARRGRDFDGEGRHAVPRGLITTDTRRLTRDLWNKPQRVAQVLGGYGRDGRARELPDVTSFVGRKPLGPIERTHIVQAQPDRRLEGTPLKPDSMGALPGRNGRSRPGQVDNAGGWAGNDKPTGGRTGGMEIHTTGGNAPSDRGGRPQRGQDGGTARPGSNDRGGDKPMAIHTPEGPQGNAPSDRGGRPPRGQDGGTARPGSNDHGGDKPMAIHTPEGPQGNAPSDRGGRPPRGQDGGTARPGSNGRSGEKPMAIRRPENGEDGGAPRASRTTRTVTPEDQPGRLPTGWRELRTTPAAERGGRAEASRSPERRYDGRPAPYSQEGGSSAGEGSNRPSRRPESERPTTVPLYQPRNPAESGSSSRESRPTYRPAPPSSTAPAQSGSSASSRESRPSGRSGSDSTASGSRQGRGDSGGGARESRGGGGNRGGGRDGGSSRPPRGSGRG